MDKAKQRQPNGGPHLVFHAKKPTFGELPHPRWPEGYWCVAVVEARDIDKVYELGGVCMSAGELAQEVTASQR